MSPELDFRDEAFVTVLTFEGALARVRHHMVFQLRLGMGKALATEGTREWRLGLVRALVAFEVGSVGKGLAAGEVHDLRGGHITTLW